MEKPDVSGVGLPFSTNPMIGGFLCFQLRKSAISLGGSPAHTHKKETLDTWDSFPDSDENELYPK
jgi:hypothetical protein